MSSHSNETEAHAFYYEGVDHGVEKSYSRCTLSYCANEAYSYSTLVAKVIPAKGVAPGDVNTSNPDSGLTLMSMDSMTSTTARHLNCLGRASPFEIVWVPMSYGSRYLSPCVLAHRFLDRLGCLTELFHRKRYREEFARLMDARATIIKCAAEEWAQPLRSKEFREFEEIEIGKVAAEIARRNRKEAAKRAASTRAALAKYVKGRSGADYLEFIRTLCDPYYRTDAYPLTDDERKLLRRKIILGDKAYVWVEGDIIRTSRKVVVSTREATTLLKAWASGKDMRGLKIGPFTILSSAGDTIKIGCHQIPRENMVALYEVLIGKPFPLDSKKGD